MKPIEYLELLALEETRPSADGSTKLLDGSARRIFDAFRFGNISEDEAVIMFMKSQKEKAEFYLNESISLRVNSTSTPIFIGG
ncbi:hypothetical protein IB212_15745 [Enterobacter sp. E12]|uniref:hypothetical protein n=1 Tax=unclassified Enterobacter TaxID=2608935 RepID=UPI001660BE82|nr:MULTISPECIES: hypothetical protein [unclassified Enterobacter]MBD0815583.1 hypothetical protein [Enterobacter sp. E12]MCI2290955.1 hypothetical protein [Enterobacter sp. I4]